MYKKIALNPASNIDPIRQRQPLNPGHSSEQNPHCRIMQVNSISPMPEAALNPLLKKADDQSHGGGICEDGSPMGGGVSFDLNINAHREILQANCFTAEADIPYFGTCHLLLPTKNTACHEGMIQKISEIAESLGLSLISDRAGKHFVREVKTNDHYIGPLAQKINPKTAQFYFAKPKEMTVRAFRYNINKIRILTNRQFRTEETQHQRYTDEDCTRAFMPWCSDTIATYKGIGFAMSDLSRYFAELNDSVAEFTSAQDQFKAKINQALIVHRSFPSGDERLSLALLKQIEDFEAQLRKMCLPTHNAVDNAGFKAFDEAVTNQITKFKEACTSWTEESLDTDLFFDAQFATQGQLYFESVKKENGYIPFHSTFFHLHARDATNTGTNPENIHPYPYAGTGVMSNNGENNADEGTRQEIHNRGIGGAHMGTDSEAFSKLGGNIIANGVSPTKALAAFIRPSYRGTEAELKTAAFIAEEYPVADGPFAGIVSVPNQKDIDEVDVDQREMVGQSSNLVAKAAPEYRPLKVYPLRLETAEGPIDIFVASSEKLGPGPSESIHSGVVYQMDAKTKTLEKKSVEISVPDTERITAVPLSRTVAEPEDEGKDVKMTFAEAKVRMIENNNNHRDEVEAITKYAKLGTDAKAFMGHTGGHRVGDINQLITEVPCAVTTAAFNPQTVTEPRMVGSDISLTPLPAPFKDSILAGTPVPAFTRLEVGHPILTRAEYTALAKKEKARSYDMTFSKEIFQDEGLPDAIYETASLEAENALIETIVQDIRGSLPKEGITLDDISEYLNSQKYQVILEDHTNNGAGRYALHPLLLAKRLDRRLKLEKIEMEMPNGQKRQLSLRDFVKVGMASGYLSTIHRHNMMLMSGGVDFLVPYAAEQFIFDSMLPDEKGCRNQTVSHDNVARYYQSLRGGYLQSTNQSGLTPQSAVHSDRMDKHGLHPDLANELGFQQDTPGMLSRRRLYWDLVQNDFARHYLDIMRVNPAEVPDDALSRSKSPDVSPRRRDSATRIPEALEGEPDLTASKRNPFTLTDQIDQTFVVVGAGGTGMKLIEHLLEKYPTAMIVVYENALSFGGKVAYGVHPKSSVKENLEVFSTTLKDNIHRIQLMTAPKGVGFNAEWVQQLEENHPDGVFFCTGGTPRGAGFKGQEHSIPADTYTQWHNGKSKKYDEIETVRTNPVTVVSGTGNQTMDVFATQDELWVLPEGSSYTRAVRAQLNNPVLAYLQSVSSDTTQTGQGIKKAINPLFSVLKIQKNDFETLLNRLFNPNLDLSKAPYTSVSKAIALLKTTLQKQFNKLQIGTIRGPIENFKVTEDEIEKFPGQLVFVIPDGEKYNNSYDGLITYMRSELEKADPSKQEQLSSALKSIEKAKACGAEFCFADAAHEKLKALGSEAGRDSLRGKKVLVFNTDVSADAAQVHLSIGPREGKQTLSIPFKETSLLHSHGYVSHLPEGIDSTDDGIKVQGQVYSNIRALGWAATGTGNLSSVSRDIPEIVAEVLQKKTDEPGAKSPQAYSYWDYVDNYVEPKDAAQDHYRVMGPELALLFQLIERGDIAADVLHEEDEFLEAIETVRHLFQLMPGQLSKGFISTSKVLDDLGVEREITFTYDSGESVKKVTVALKPIVEKLAEQRREEGSTQRITALDIYNEVLASEGLKVKSTCAGGNSCHTCKVDDMEDTKVNACSITPEFIFDAGHIKTVEKVEGKKEEGARQKAVTIEYQTDGGAPAEKKRTPSPSATHTESASSIPRDPQTVVSDTAPSEKKKGVTSTKPEDAYTKAAHNQQRLLYELTAEQIEAYQQLFPEGGSQKETESIVSIVKTEQYLRKIELVNPALAIEIHTKYEALSEEIKAQPNPLLSPDQKKLVNDYVSFKLGAEVVITYDNETDIPIEDKCNSLKQYIHYMMPEKYEALSQKGILDSVSKLIVNQLLVGGGMSLGALSPEFHQLLAEVCSEMGIVNSSGEGGGDSPNMMTQLSGALFGTTIGNASKAIFVHGKFLVHVSRIDQKFNQGAKKGGGKMPGEKVSPLLSRLRRVMEGETLDSPPVIPAVKSVEQIFIRLILHTRSMFLPGHDALDKDSFAAAEVGGFFAKIMANNNAVSIFKALIRNGWTPNLAGMEGGTAAATQTQVNFDGLPSKSTAAVINHFLQKSNMADGKRYASGGVQNAQDILELKALGFDSEIGALLLVLTGQCVMLRVCGQVPHFTQEELKNVLKSKLQDFSSNRVHDFVDELFQAGYISRSAGEIKLSMKFPGEFSQSVRERFEADGIKLAHEDDYQALYDAIMEIKQGSCTVGVASEFAFNQQKVTDDKAKIRQVFAENTINLLAEVAERLHHVGIHDYEQAKSDWDTKYAAPNANAVDKVTDHIRPETLGVDPLLKDHRSIKRPIPGYTDIDRVTVQFLDAYYQEKEGEVAAMQRFMDDHQKSYTPPLFRRENNGVFYFEADVKNTDIAVLSHLGPLMSYLGMLDDNPPQMHITLNGQVGQAALSLLPKNVTVKAKSLSDGALERLAGGTVVCDEIGADSLWGAFQGDVYTTKLHEAGGYRANGDFKADTKDEESSVAREINLTVKDVGDYAFQFQTCGSVAVYGECNDTCFPLLAGGGGEAFVNQIKSPWVNHHPRAVKLTQREADKLFVRFEKQSKYFPEDKDLQEILNNWDPNHFVKLHLGPMERLLEEKVQQREAPDIRPETKITLSPGKDEKACFRLANSLRKIDQKEGPKALTYEFTGKLKNGFGFGLPDGVRMKLDGHAGQSAAEYLQGGEVYTSHAGHYLMCNAKSGLAMANTCGMKPGYMMQGGLAMVHQFNDDVVPGSEFIAEGMTGGTLILTGQNTVEGQYLSVGDHTGGDIILRKGDIPDENSVAISSTKVQELYENFNNFIERHQQPSELVGKGEHVICKYIQTNFVSYRAPFTPQKPRQTEGGEAPHKNTVRELVGSG